MEYYSQAKNSQDLLNRLSMSKEHQRIIESINANTSLPDDEKKKAIIASRYLNSVGKGENALELCYVLQDNLDKKGTTDYKDFNVPTYIKNAIEEICE